MKCGMITHSAKEAGQQKKQWVGVGDDREVGAGQGGGVDKISEGGGVGKTGGLHKIEG